MFRLAIIATLRRCLSDELPKTLGRQGITADGSRESGVIRAIKTVHGGTVVLKLQGQSNE